MLFGKTEEGRAIRGILMKGGYEVEALCSTGAQALTEADNLGGGIIVCGYKYPDMIYSELKDYLPRDFEMLLISSAAVVEEGVPEGVVPLTMPLKTVDLYSTLGMMLGRQARLKKKLRSVPKKRSAEEQDIIDRAKAVLMDRNHMSEEEAHRYLQKCSMESGIGMVESAQMVLTLMDS